jgi:acetyl esterase
VRTYSPRSRPDEPLPAVVYFHGGGWVSGRLDDYDYLCSVLAADARCVVASVDYRLAPECRYPAAADDAYEAAAWIASATDELGVDAHRIAVAGTSAGANLALSTLYRAREQGRPAFIFQALLYPMLEIEAAVAHMPHGAELGEERARYRWFWREYLGDEFDHPPEETQPLTWDDLASLPAALVIAAGLDPLCTEARRYAERLTAAGQEVLYVEYSDERHGFMSLKPDSDVAKAARHALATALDAAFSAGNPERRVPRQSNTYAVSPWHCS